MTIDEEISKFTHEVEEVFQEVKQHMIVSVRDYSIQIAFVLMGITTAILILGTIYVRCFHHPKRTSDKGIKAGKQKNGDTKGEKSKDNSDKIENKIVESEKLEEAEEKVVALESEQIEQNGHVRKRTTSSSTSASVNNNNSPVKSKIPVRQKSVTKSP
ncbi:hypothetical protein ACF0H5_014103 [Mactra antiquata]